MDNGCIHIEKVRVNNLKGVTLDIPRGKFVVITGLSGSGKSSLAFDTLYAEGQRRYVESLSAYARQFLGRIKKPECDYISGLPPTIAIRQHVSNRNPRSTVGTTTEIYDYLKLLYARIGKTCSPISGIEVKKHDIEDLVECMNSYPSGVKFTVLAPVKLSHGENFQEKLHTYFKEGFTRLDLNGEFIMIADLLGDGKLMETVEGKNMHLLVARLTCDSSKESLTRLTDSAETAFFEGDGECMLRFYDSPETTLHTFSNRFEADGICFEQPTEHLFSFNSPLGACPTCEGFGQVLGIDENLVIPNRLLSVYDGAVVCWRGEKMVEWKNYFMIQAERDGFPIFTPYFQLTESEKEYLWHGVGATSRIDGWDSCCIDNFFRMVEKNLYKIQYRVMLARYKGKTVCPDCKGKRLKKEATYVKVGGKSITELVGLHITELKEFFDTLSLSDHERQTAKRLLDEIRKRIELMINVGLEYLTLNRLSNTLSGGESQRINIVTSLGSSLVGSLYVLDEPSIGLHSRDTDKLIRVLHQLRDIGNTVVVVEHDEEIIRAADYIIDVGPEAGRSGGTVVYEGSMENLSKGSGSHTVRYLLGEEIIPVPGSRRSWHNFIEVKGACKNNLKGIDVKFPLNIMTVVTGVSGSGKSTLVKEVLYRQLQSMFDEGCGVKSGLTEGSVNMIKAVEYVDQDPIGRSSRSNPVIYIKAYNEIRKLYADTPLSRQMGYKSGHFSFNSDGGRCEECKGDGTTTISMQFMSDLRLVCESCKGKRFKNSILEVTYRSKNIWDILEMTVNQAIEFFSEVKGSCENKIVKKLEPLQRVGLGYIKLGQSSSTLSGGESQRVKLAYYLSLEKAEPTMFIFDEPTTGLHFHDIKKLLDSFQALIERGHTILVIEHNMDVIKCADHIIDMGPEGGAAGGRIVICGTPEEVAACPESYTGRFLHSKLPPNKI